MEGNGLSPYQNDLLMNHYSDAAFDAALEAGLNQAILLGHQNNFATTMATQYYLMIMNNVDWRKEFFVNALRLRRTGQLGLYLRWCDLKMWATAMYNGLHRPEPHPAAVGWDLETGEYSDDDDPETDLRNASPEDLHRADVSGNYKVLTQLIFMIMNKVEEMVRDCDKDDIMFVYGSATGTYWELYTDENQQQQVRLKQCWERLV